MDVKFNPLILLVAIAVLMFSRCADYTGKIIYVNSKASVGGNGTTWDSAFNSLQEALDTVGRGDEIWVASGIYKPSRKTGGEDDRNKTFHLKKGVALYGGFSGKETVLDQRNWQDNKVILSGDLNGDDDGFANNIENCFHVVTGNKTDETAVFDGFIITAGNADADVWPDDGGGGMNNHEGSPTVRNCTFIGNAAFADGGGMRNWGKCTSMISNCTFIRNRAEQEGGGMMNGPGSSPVVTNCIFMGNSTGEDGGGIYNNESHPIITNCLFRGNSVDLTGGGMYNVNGSTTRVINCTFSRNSADKAGGGMSNLRSNPILTNCILWDDAAPADPEIHNTDSDPAVTNSNIGGGYKGSGNIDADPLFADKDLRLSAESPCVDAGDNTTLPEDVKTDLDNSIRISNDIVDLGAYEFKKIDD